MKSHSSPTLVLSLSISLLIHGMGCSSSASSIANPSAPLAYQPTRESLGELETGTKVTVLFHNLSTLRGWFEGINEQYSDSSGIRSDSRFRVAIRYTPEYGTFQHTALLAPDSVLSLHTGGDEPTRSGGVLVAFIAVAALISGLAIATGSFRW